MFNLTDARERFHYVNLILIVFMRNMTELNWDVGEQELCNTLFNTPTLSRER